MRFAYLSPLGACTHHCCTSNGLIVLRDHTNRVFGVAATVYQREQVPRRFGRKLDSEDGKERSRRGLPEGTLEPQLHVVKAQGIHGVTRPGAWPLRGIPCEGLQRGLGESLCASRYLSKNTGVVDESLHISTLLFSFRIYIDYILLLRKR